MAKLGKKAVRKIVQCVLQFSLEPVQVRSTAKAERHPDSYLWNELSDSMTNKNCRIRSMSIHGKIRKGSPANPMKGLKYFLLKDCIRWRPPVGIR